MSTKQIGQWKLNCHKTKVPGFKFQILRWENQNGACQGKFAGIMLRGFGRRLMVYVP